MNWLAVDISELTQSDGTGVEEAGDLHVRNALSGATDPPDSWNRISVVWRTPL